MIPLNLTADEITYYVLGVVQTSVLWWSVLNVVHIWSNRGGGDDE